MNLKSLKLSYLKTKKDQNDTDKAMDLRILFLFYPLRPSQVS